MNRPRRCVHSLVALLWAAGAWAAAGAGSTTLPVGAVGPHDDAPAAPAHAELLAEGDSGGDWKQRLLGETDARLQAQMTTRLAGLLNGTRTPACAEEVALSFEAFVSGHLTETLLPFESPFVQNQCPQDPPRELMEEGAPLKAPADLRLLYLILAHQDFEQVVRLIRALQDEDITDGEAAAAAAAGAATAKAGEPKSHFVVHVDGKVPLLPAARALLDYAALTPNVHVMTAEGRVNVSWGGFSVVQATLNAMAYGFHLGLPFDRVINLSGATYPVATPAAIRRTLARHALHEQLLFIDPTPTVPLPRVWHYFVECDNAMHRVARFVLPRGVPLRTGSQWFILSRAFAHYLLTDEALVAPYTAYAQHVLIPDESFFATVLKASPWCHFHANTNYLHLTFDVWEDEKGDARDRAKCLQPDPSFCGRSPKLVDAAEVPALFNSSANTVLFARKFESSASAAALAAIDARLAQMRAEEEAAAVSIVGLGAAAAAGAATCGGGEGGVECGEGGELPVVGMEEGESVLAKHGISLETMVW